MFACEIHHVWSCESPTSSSKDIDPAQEGARAASIARRGQRRQRAPSVAAKVVAWCPMEISRMLMGVQWEFNGDLMGYNVIYIYTVYTLGLCGGYPHITMVQLFKTVLTNGIMLG